MAAERAGFGGKLRRVLGRGKDDQGATAPEAPAGQSPHRSPALPAASRTANPPLARAGRVAPPRDTPTKVTPAKAATAGSAKSAPATRAVPAKTQTVVVPSKVTSGSVPAKKAAAAKQAAPAKTAPAKTARASASPPVRSSPSKPAKASEATTSHRAARRTAVQAPEPSQEKIIDAPAPEPTTVRTAAKAPAKTRKAPAKKAAAAATAADSWTEAELGEVRGELEAQAKELRGEIDDAEIQSNEIQQAASNEGSGDEADAGTKTFEREHEMSLANNSRDLLLQVERALARLDAGTYGRCENCGNPIPKPRLQAFPRVTLCVSCKQREERR